ncbi:hypothetical protein BDN71DRAFT_599893 [Pleurotus eryngii]|uniref:Uncharacterized protein n=1 Tax=Pleurotus eryngii TaxID=5323 RepID=A0A9P5ZL03_PLEER|nr:hypothetical protein BDN71DRAFT_599893 [Pleurotus eryngii]
MLEIYSPLTHDFNLDLFVYIFPNLFLLYAFALSIFTFLIISYCIVVLDTILLIWIRTDTDRFTDGYASRCSAHSSSFDILCLLLYGFIYILYSEFICTLFNATYILPTSFGIWTWHVCLTLRRHDTSSFVQRYSCISFSGCLADRLFLVLQSFLLPSPVTTLSPR